MRYQVRIKKKVDQGLKKLPKNVQKLLFLLIEDLMAEGPVQKSLTYRHVACWTCRKGEIEIEVYYVGSREKAPY